VTRAWPRYVRPRKLEADLFIDFMKLNNCRSLTILTVITLTLNLTPVFASNNNQSKHHVTKKQAERIALGKVHGGTVRTAELQTANGRRFWSVYVQKPGSKNAKEVRVDETTGTILTVQTEKPEDQAEEPAKTH
jgi:hypothetical protein